MFKNTRRHILALAVNALILAAGAHAQIISGEVTWSKIGDDLEIAQAQLRSTPIFSSQLTLLRTSLERYKVGVLRALEYGSQTKSVKSLCRAAKAAVCVNANFFDEQDRALGLVISRGNILNRLHRGGSLLDGVFQVSNGAVSIVDRKKFNASSVTDAVQAGPILIRDGKQLPKLAKSSDYSRRAGVCIDNQKRLVIFFVPSGLIGARLDHLQEALIHPKINCREALNFDGGGSAQFYVSSKIPGASSDMQEIVAPGSDFVPVALALFVRKN